MKDEEIWNYDLINILKDKTFKIKLKSGEITGNWSLDSEYSNNFNDEIIHCKKNIQKKEITFDEMIEFNPMIKNELDLLLDQNQFDENEKI